MFFVPHLLKEDLLVIFAGMYLRSVYAFDWRWVNGRLSRTGFGSLFRVLSA
jgi:hypothetical protein